MKFCNALIAALASASSLASAAAAIITTDLSLPDIITANIPNTPLSEESKHRPTVYLIRHGEKPKKGNGLSAVGVQRAQCLRTIFGDHSDYHIGHIMAQKPKSNGKQKRPFDTVKPLAKDLGLKVDTKCDRDDTDCVVNKIKNYTGKGNILICWEHKRLKKIVRALGVTHKVASYPEDRFDLVWTVPPAYRRVTDVSSESCPDLDGKMRPVW
ncbi:hypothetical protein TD95_005257 [Thielaviopsis punctulata]|uniref:Phosphoglycerate mutase family protein n=1 Tax=Thielaviopsis punctulata TaxID=72032 RepID=A0A0F4ZG36_9PEZI|nr:hypothetical protein TD95_005257 [Thielaviopsis punctulata]